MTLSSFATTSILAIASATSSVSAAPETRSNVRSHSVEIQRILEGHDHDSHDHGDDHDDHEHCKMYEIDFVMVEGDALRSSVEDEIVEMLEHVGVKVNTKRLTKEDFNAVEQAGDFHLSFSETWGAPYDPHAYASGWVAQDEGHFQALAGLEAPDTRDSLFGQIDDVLQEESQWERGRKWEAIHKVVHDNAVMLPLWGARIPTVMNRKRLTNFKPGNQQFDYPVHELEVIEGSSTVTIAPGAQTGLFQTVGRLDPHTYRPNEFFANNWVYEGLVSYGNNGQVLPALASSWKVADQGAGQRYIFQLRPDVKFHDGADWNCAAAKINFDHVLAAPLRTSDYHGWYGMVAQIKDWECAGDLELVIDTKGKYYPFLQELSFIRPLRMLSPAAFPNDADPLTANSCHVGWGDITSDGVTVKCAGTTAISGTGPFMFSDRTSVALDADTTVDSQVVFNAHSSYWGKVPSIDTLIVKRYENSDAVKAALLNGSLDLVWGSGVLPTQDLVELDENEENDISVFHSDDIQNVVILLNSGKAPLDDINLRKTIIHAIDKKTIIKNELGGLFKPVDNVFPLDAPYSDVDLTPRWDYDLEKAQFLNCPAPNKEPNTGLAVGLGLGLGGAALGMLSLAIFYYRRSKKMEVELEAFLIKEEGHSA